MSDNTTLDNISVNSEKVVDYTIHHDDRKELERLVSHNKGVEKIVSELAEGAGQLGPLEQPYSQSRDSPRSTH